MEGTLLDGSVENLAGKAAEGAENERHVAVVLAVL